MTDEEKRDRQRRLKELSFKLQKETLERALESENGVRATFRTRSEAVNFRHRCYLYRAFDREWNASLYPSDHPMHGLSMFDDLLIVFAKDDPCVLLFQKRTVTVHLIEPGL